jgi:hypothetical protein
VGRVATHIDKHCTVCGAIENDSHLFFLCNLPQQVWDTTVVTPFTQLILTLMVFNMFSHIFYLSTPLTKI